MAIDPLSILGLGYDVIKNIHDLIKHKVTIEPKKYEATSSDWNSIKTFLISNSTDKPVYDIQIIIWVNEGNNDINISVEDQEKGHEEKIGDIIMNTDLFIASGKVKNKFLKLIQLRYLPQNTSRRIFIKFKDEGRYNIQVVRYSSQSNSLSVTDGKIAVPFITPPFPMELLSVSFLLKKNL